MDIGNYQLPITNRCIAGVLLSGFTELLRAAPDDGLGAFVVEKLQQRRAGDIFVPRQADYDLREKEAIPDMLDDARPDLIIHLAAAVGGIGANQSHQAEFFYDNPSTSSGQA